MKSHWRDRSGYAASGACSAPNSGKKERSAWLPPSSGTNSSAGTTKSKVKIFRKGSRNFLTHGDSKVRKRREIRRPKLQRFSRPAMQRVLMGFLLAHCGGGQDQPGCLGPSAKRPGSVFSDRPPFPHLPASGSRVAIPRDYPGHGGGQSRPPP